MITMITEVYNAFREIGNKRGHNKRGHNKRGQSSFILKPSQEA